MDYMLDFKDCVVVHHSSNGRIVFASGASLSHLEHIPQETRTQKNIPQETDGFFVGFPDDSRIKFLL